MAAISHTKITSSELIRTGSCRLRGFLIGTDGTNDPTVTIYDNTSAAGLEVVPTATYDASALGMNGAILPGDGIHCTNGIYCEITIGGGLVEVSVYYSLRHDI